LLVVSIPASESAGAEIGSDIEVGGVGVVRRSAVCARSLAGWSRRANAAEFPLECSEPAYVERLKTGYRIHPELFARLYEDWSSLERFQRTRGVLRLMAQVIHALWAHADQSPLILPGSAEPIVPALPGGYVGAS
jgi:predicted AAA+ superfamily ATPase